MCGNTCLHRTNVCRWRWTIRSLQKLKKMCKNKTDCFLWLLPEDSSYSMHTLFVFVFSSCLFCSNSHEIVLISKDQGILKNGQQHTTNIKNVGDVRCCCCWCSQNLLGELHLDVQLAGVLRQLDAHIKEHVVDEMHSHLVQQQMVLTLCKHMRPKERSENKEERRKKSVVSWKIIKKWKINLLLWWLKHVRKIWIEKRTRRDRYRNHWAWAKQLSFVHGVKCLFHLANEKSSFFLFSQSFNEQKHWLVQVM